MINRQLSHLAAAIMLLAAAGCSGDMTRIDSTEEEAPVRFGISSRAAEAASGTTYRIVSYNTTTLLMNRTGTYWLESTPSDGSVAELVPCVLDDSGVRIDGVPDDNFSGASGAYKVVCVSPGVINNANGSFDLPLNDGGVKIYASEYPEQVTFGPYGLISMKNPMKECRALVEVSFYKKNDDTVDEFTVDSLRIVGSGSGDTVTYFPAKRQVSVDPDDTRAITLDPVSDGDTDVEGYTRCFSSEKKLAIVPAIYAPKLVAAEILGMTTASNLEEGNYLLLRCNLRQGGRDPVKVELPLTAAMPEILPQREYLYRVLVSSNYISLKVDVVEVNGNNGWENGGTEGGTIGGPSDKLSIDLGSWTINGWEEDNLGEQEI